MQEKNIASLYQIIVKNSWSNDEKNYLDLLFKNGKKFAKSEEELGLLIDKTLKKILSNLKNNVPEEIYENMIMNLGIYNNQEAYDFAIGLILSYYRDEFIIDGTEYSVIDIMYNIVEQYKTEQTLPIPNIFHYILACLFRIHYALYIEKN